MDEYLEANRQLWENWTRINLGSRFYDVKEFAAGRGRDLDPIARAGPGDVRGKSLLHLQCQGRGGSSTRSQPPARKPGPGADSSGARLLLLAGRVWPPQESRDRLSLRAGPRWRDPALASRHDRRGLRGIV